MASGNSNNKLTGTEAASKLGCTIKALDKASVPFERKKRYGGGTIRLYDLEVIKKFEALVTKKSQKRSDAALAAHDKKRKQLLECINSTTVRVRILPMQTLRRRAISFALSNDDSSQKFDFDDPKIAATVLRWMVNTVRHELTDYDKAWEYLFGKTGCDEAGVLWRGRVYTAISKAYPYLEDECTRQLKERESHFAC